MVDADMVRRSYRELLHREPENDTVIATCIATHRSWEELVQNITQSAEYKIRHLGYLPAVDPSQICNWNCPIKILEPDHSDGNISVQEMVILNMLVASRRPMRIFELGTFDERTTLNLGRECAGRCPCLYDRSSGGG